MSRVGLELPMIEVRFENLKIQAEAHAGARALPTVPNYFINKLEVENHTSKLSKISQ